MSKIKFFLFMMLKIAVSIISVYGAIVCYSYSFIISALLCCTIPVVILLFPLCVKRVHLMNTKEFFAVVLMLVSCFFSLRTYSYIHEGFWRNTVKSFSVVPGFLPIIFAILLYISLFVKGFISLPQKAYNYLIMVCDIVFLSSFMTVFISSEKWKLFGLFELPFSAQTLAILAILISYLGIKAAAGFAWIILLVSGFSHIMKIDTAMGMYVIPYLLCAFVSILLQVQDEIKFKEMIENGIFSGKKAVKKVGSDIKASGEVIQNTAAKVSSSVLTATTGVPIRIKNQEIENE